ncbi:MAG: DUF2306 domain-containing protein [Bacteroidota bacterium]|nr:DUF2306 domain-containing protein [Bacteroidota bacterium]
MGKSIQLTQVKPKSYIRLGFTIFLIVLAGKFVISNALPYFGFQKERLGSYWEDRWALIAHISGGLLALAIGPFQFSKKFRNKFMTAHRWLGRIYLVAILVGTIASTYLAWTNSVKLNFSWAFGLQMLAVAWISTSAMAYLSVIRGRMLQHKEWMIRSYVVTFAFVTFRWLNDLPLAHQLMSKPEERAPTIVWLSWTLPLLIAEILLSWKKK